MERLGETQEENLFGAKPILEVLREMQVERKRKIIEAIAKCEAESEYGPLAPQQREWLADQAAAWVEEVVYLRPEALTGPLRFSGLGRP